MGAPAMGARAIASLALIAIASPFAPLHATERGIEVSVRASEAADAAVESVRLYGASHALVIGIDAYTGGWPRLSNGVKDARAVAAELERRGFTVMLRTDLESRALKQTFEEFFVVNGADPQARLFVWFSGHGATLGEEAFLVPADAPRPEAGPRFKLYALSLRRFGKLLALAQSKHAFAIFDSGFAGTIFRVERPAPPAAITRVATFPVRQFLTSAGVGETVPDDGAFRKLFVRALQGEEPANANGDGYLTASELAVFVSDRVRYLRLGQTPAYGKLRDPGFDHGDFVFLTPATLRDQRVAASDSVTEPVSGETRARLDLAFWQSVGASGERALIEAYLEQFPRGTFAAIARRKLGPVEPEPNARETTDSRTLTPAQRADIAHWNRISDYADPGYFEVYLRRHPNGRFVELARYMREVLEGGLGARAVEAMTPAGRADIAHWNRIKGYTDGRYFEVYLARYPDGRFAEAARDRLRGFESETLTPAQRAEIAHWNRIKGHTDGRYFQVYLERYPNGRFVEAARDALQESGIESLVLAREAEIAYWNRIKDYADPGYFQVYLERYPNGRFVEAAHEALAARDAPGSEGRGPLRSISVQAIERAWSEIEDATDPQVLLRFLRRHRYGKYHSLALRRLAELEGGPGQQEASVSTHPFDGQWNMTLTCNRDGDWESLVAVNDGKIDHSQRWYGGYGLVLGGTFGRNGELNIEGWLISYEHAPQRTWATATGSGRTIEGRGGFGDYGRCEFVANRR